MFNNVPGFLIKISWYIAFSSWKVKIFEMMNI